MIASPRTARAAAAGLAIAAALAAGGAGGPGEHRVLLLDESRSVRGDAEGRDRALSAAGPSTPVLAFGAGGSTDLEAALRAALDRIPSGARGEVLIATDGRATRGDAAAAVAEARRRGVRVRTVPLGGSGLPARAARADAPPVVRAGERFAISVEVTGSPGARGDLVLEDEAAGAARRRAVEVPAGGGARVVFARTAAGPGLLRFRAFVEGAAADAAPGTTVLVEGPAAILRLGGRPAGPGTAALLRGLGDGAFADAAGEEAVAAALATADLGSLAGIVLDDLPESALPADGGERIRRAVESGLGVAVLGGPGTLGAGGFAGRPIEEALPVRCAPDRPRPLVVLAVDGSGSMGEAPSGESTLAARARLAAVAAARRLPADARLAIVRFADGPAAVEGPFDIADPAGRAAAEEAAGRTPPPAGGTRFGAAVESALALAGRAGGGGARHLVVVTDGRPAEEASALADLGAALARARFRVRVLPVGREPDGDRLAAFAAAADGTVEEPGPAASALARAVLEAAASDPAAWEPRGVAVRAGPDPAPWGAAAAGLPPADGYDRVDPRDGARVWLSADDGAPLLVAGPRGLGRAVVFATAPAAGDGAWLSPPAASLLAAAIRWALRAPGAEGAEAEARLREDGTIAVRLETPTDAPPRGDVSAGDGAPLRRTGAARWTGVLPAGEAALGVIAFAAAGALLARAPVRPEPAAEDLALGPDASALAALETPAGPAAARSGAGAAAAAAALLALGLLLAAAVPPGTASSARASVQGP